MAGGDDSVTWSDELFRIFQMDPAEGALRSPSTTNSTVPKTWRACKAAVDAAIKQGTAYALELRPRRRDGSTRVCLARGYPETGPNHEVTHLYGSLQDITEFKQAEEQLRLAASVFEHSFEAILITDAENRIIDTNPAFSAITGYEQASVRQESEHPRLRPPRPGVLP
jgi:PAS domain-containing protein